MVLLAGGRMVQFSAPPSPKTLPSPSRKILGELSITVLEIHITQLRQLYNDVGIEARSIIQDPLDAALKLSRLCLSHEHEAIRAKYLNLFASLLEENRANAHFFDQFLASPFKDSFAEALLWGIFDAQRQDKITLTASYLHVSTLLTINVGRKCMPCPTLLSSSLTKESLLQGLVLTLTSMLLPKGSSQSNRPQSLALLMALLEHPDTKKSSGQIIRKVTNERGALGSAILAIAKSWLQDPSAITSLILCFRLCILDVSVLTEPGTLRAALEFTEETLASTSLFPQTYLAMCVLLREIQKAPPESIDSDFVDTLGRMLMANVTVTRDSYQYYLLKALIQGSISRCPKMDPTARASFSESLRLAIDEAACPQVAADFAKFTAQLGGRGTMVRELELQEDPDAHIFLLPLIHSKLYNLLRENAHPKSRNQ